ncbi:MAG TPA: pilus assembly protein TadG-related protein, partial [Acidimicrobiales bacterium]|nr:pilus assembly protein TadG-related protein [Acidimicrobiales bacterium]
MIVYVVLAIFVIMGMAAFVIDLGYWYFQASRVQRAADAAALAGVTYMPGDVPDATAVARNVAQANGFSAPDDDVQVNAVSG